MIVVRNVFQLKFGKSREAVALWKKGAVMLRKSTNAQVRLMTDVTGPFYTLVMELQFKTLADFERGHGSAGASKEWSAWYKRFSALVESGHREIFKTVE